MISIAIVVVTVALIILTIVIFTHRPAVGINIVGGTKRDLGFDPDSFIKPSGERFSNPQSMHSLIRKPIYIPQGTSVPFEPGKIPTQINTNGTSVTGLSTDPKSMFMFSYNKYGPQCCPSTYSTSSGCVCMTEQQKNFINSRGYSK